MRVASSAHAIFRRNSQAADDAVRAPVASTPITGIVGPREASARIVVVISKPEPISATIVLPDASADAAAPLNAPVEHVAATTCPVGRTASARNVLQSTRHRPSPVAAARKRGKPTSSKPRRSPAVRAVVAVRPASVQSVRMQAALMKCQRRRDAERALAKLTAQLPSATIHPLRKAA